jgi:hypothetical protein
MRSGIQIEAIRFLCKFFEVFKKGKGPPPFGKDPFSSHKLSLVNYYQALLYSSILSLYADHINSCRNR